MLTVASAIVLIVPLRRRILLSVNHYYTTIFMNHFSSISTV